MPYLALTKMLINSIFLTRVIDMNKLIQIANPIYDVVFKYLLEDNKIAKLIISRITPHRPQRLSSGSPLMPSVLLQLALRLSRTRYWTSILFLKLWD